jgi:hypothetical protein
MKTSKFLIGLALIVLPAVSAGCGHAQTETGSPAGSGGSADSGGFIGSGGTAGGESPAGSGGFIGSGAGGGGAGSSSGATTGGMPGATTGGGGSPGTTTGGTSGGAGGAGGSGGSGQDVSIPGVEVLLSSGDKVVGQLIAEYDHSVWWVNPSDEKTLAIFDAAKFGDYPNDHSIQLLSSYDVQSVKDITLPPGTVVYRDMLRNKGMVHAQMPVNGPLYVATGNGGAHLEENGNGNFAWDLVRASAGGKSYTGTGKANTDYLIWDAPVVLPIGGYVVEVIRDSPDNVPGEFGINLEQNLVGVHLGGQYYLYMLHMRQNTIPASVKTGATLPAGTVVGHVGNSGASIQPHLHMTLVWYDDVTQRIWGVPSEWSNLWSASSPAGPSVVHDYHVPTVETWISSSQF